MDIARIEAHLEVAWSADTSCSVLWLVPERDPEELADAMAAIGDSAAEMPASGFVGVWEGSELLAAHAADIARSTELSARFSVGQTRMISDMVALPASADEWFWPLFAMKVRPHQICAALVPAGDVSSGWKFAGLQLVLAAAARQARPGSSHGFTLRALEQAFLAETLTAGGIAVTRLRAELLPPGIALTSTPAVIDRIRAALAGARPVEPLLVDRSRHLGGAW
jgi:hypothetical protein